MFTNEWIGMRKEVTFSGLRVLYNLLCAQPAETRKTQISVNENNTLSLA
jgi:hypothetical protein